MTPWGSTKSCERFWFMFFTQSIWMLLFWLPALCQDSWRPLVQPGPLPDVSERPQCLVRCDPGWPSPVNWAKCSATDKTIFTALGWLGLVGREGGGYFWPAPDEWETSQRGPDPHQGVSLNAQHPLEQGVLTCVVDHLSLGKVEPCQVLDLCVHRQPCQYAATG